MDALCKQNYPANIITIIYALQTGKYKIHKVGVFQRIKLARGKPNHCL